MYKLKKKVLNTRNTQTKLFIRNNENRFLVTKKKKKIHKRILFVKLKCNTGIKKKIKKVRVSLYKNIVYMKHRFKIKQSNRLFVLY